MILRLFGLLFKANALLGRAKALTSTNIAYIYCMDNIHRLCTFWAVYIDKMGILGIYYNQIYESTLNFDGNSAFIP